MNIRMQGCALVQPPTPWIMKAKKHIINLRIHGGEDKQSSLIETLISENTYEKVNLILHPSIWMKG